MDRLILTATLKELAEGLKGGAYTSAELTAAYIKRAAEQNALNNAFITLCEEQAMTAAARADERLKAGDTSPLLGIPVAVKDNICTRDIKTTCASKMLADFLPPYDATAVARLKGAGAVIMGKTNMDEFAMGSTSCNSYFGRVSNPHNLKKVAGGSSGGSAAAVAASMCPAALGSDTGGSVRQPAAFCGITGLKPTYGRVSRYGLIAFSSSLDQVGTMAKTAYDCGIVLNAVGGADSLDATCSSMQNTDATALIGKGHRGVIGLPKEFFEVEISGEVAAAVAEAIECCKNLGYTLKQVSLPSLKYATAAYYLISSAEAASNLARFDGIKYGHRSRRGKSYEELIENSRREGFGREVKRRIMLGNYALSGGYYDEYYARAVKIRQKIKQEYEEIFKECDLLLTPTTATTAFTAGAAEKDPVKLYSADILTVTANIAGLPAISTPCGYDKKGMPIAISFTGKPFGEAEIIAAAHNFEVDFNKGGLGL